jgi:uncharacterized protein (TIGR02594 family)
MNPVSLGSSTSSSNQAVSNSNRSADYTVKQGDTLSEIADRKGVTLEELKAANPDIASQKYIYPGDQLQIPSGGKGSDITHDVKAGDTLSAIASRYDMSVPELAKYNNISNPDRIDVGDTIRIPANASDRPQVDNTGLKAPTPATPAAPGAPTGSNFNLGAALDSSKGSNALAATIIGNAEGTRTPSGGFTSAYNGHKDPGNGVRNQGSFSYQHAASSPQDADKKQLTTLTAQMPKFEEAARKAGVDPNNPRLSMAYMDMYNQSPTAAARMLTQLDTLAGKPITAESIAKLRFDSFVDSSTGQRFTNPNGQTAGGGFAKIARDNLGRAPSEKEIQAVILADQTRRTNAMEKAMTAQGVFSPSTASANPTEAVQGSTAAQSGSTPWLSVARGELGVTEGKGSANNPRVLEYHATTSGKASSDDVPWCSSFVNWSMEQAGYKGTDNAMARSWSNWGEAVPKGQVKPGDVIVFPRGNDPAKGHVAIVSSVNADGSITVVGGNQTKRGTDGAVTESTRHVNEAIAIRRPTAAERIH